jgi:hypothetical protein
MVERIIPSVISVKVAAGGKPVAKVLRSDASQARQHRNCAS